MLTAISDHRLDLTNDSVRLAAERTTLAVERTRLAHERTLMAWVRTATSLISFGFTIYKTFNTCRISRETIAFTGRLLRVSLQ